jgi:hypothetical protein
MVVTAALVAPPAVEEPLVTAAMAAMEVRQLLRLQQPTTELVVQPSLQPQLADLVGPEKMRLV